MTEAFPLQWPEGWPRTPDGRRSANYRLKTVSFDVARHSIFSELRILRASSVVLSTNIPLRRDGMAYADAARRRMDDPGVAVYFQLRDKPMAMARDVYHDIAQNLRSLALAVEYMRGLERHGGATMVERAFTGFAQLPPPAGASPSMDINWKEELDLVDLFDQLDNYDLLILAESRYRKKAKEVHSDTGGDDTAMIRLNLAITLARKELGGA